MNKRARTSRSRYWGVLFLLAIAGVFFIHRHFHRGLDGSERRLLDSDPDVFLVTGYCDCGKCCGWRRSWFGFGAPVYDSGPLRGKPKQVGITASGARAKHGTVAADPKVFSFKTRLYIPGYGEGIVEDVGGSIRNRHIDIWFPTHSQARKWGRKFLKITRR